MYLLELNEQVETSENRRASILDFFTAVYENICMILLIKWNQKEVIYVSLTLFVGLMMTSAK